MALSDVDICNMALRELPARTISSLDAAYDQSQSAIECAANYQIVVQEMLEGYSLDFTICRSALAVVANPRANEWGNAYALPSNMAKPLRVLPDLMNSGLVPSGAQTWLSTFGPFPWPADDGNDPFRIPYIIAGGVLYTNQSTAWLEFRRTDVDASLFAPSLARAIALELASRICIPILKSESREKTLMGKAELAKQRAQADDLNRKPNADADYVSAEEMARNGYGWGSTYPPFNGGGWS